MNVFLALMALREDIGGVLCIVLLRGGSYF